MAEDTPPPPSAPPAWYPDPTVRGGWRYWNGSAWSDFRVGTARPPAAAQPPPPGRNGSKRTLLILAGIGGALMLLFAACVAVIDVGTRSAPASTSTAAAPSREAPSSAAPETTARTTTATGPGPTSRILQITLPPGTEPDGQPGADSEFWTTPLAPSDLTDYLRERLPVGKSFGNLAWCDASENPRTGGAMWTWTTGAGGGYLIVDTTPALSPAADSPGSSLTVSRGSNNADACENPTRPSQIPPTASTIPGDGMFVVGKDVVPGTYRSSGGKADGFTCIWKRLDDDVDSPASVIDYGIGAGPQIVEIKPSDKIFKTEACAIWTKQ